MHVTPTKNGTGHVMNVRWQWLWIQLYDGCLVVRLAPCCQGFSVNHTLACIWTVGVSFPKIWLVQMTSRPIESRRAKTAKKSTCVKPGFSPLVEIECQGCHFVISYGVVNSQGSEQAFNTTYPTLPIIGVQSCKFTSFFPLYLSFSFVHSACCMSQPPFLCRLLYPYVV